MKITICGSMHFFDEILDLQKELEGFGHIVETPEQEGLDIDYSRLSEKDAIDLKQKFIDTHIEKIRNSDAILVANHTKRKAKKITLVQTHFLRWVSPIH